LTLKRRSQRLRGWLLYVGGISMIVAEILWRVAREERRFWVTIWATIAAAAGAVIAALPVIGSWLCRW